MRIIPSICDPETPSSEKKVFLKFKNLNRPEMDNWIIFHSLKYPATINKENKQSYKYFGESDFLILVPGKGIINIEVKGGEITCKNGEWFIKGRNDIYPKKLDRSPIRQAENTKYHIQKYFEAKFNKKYPQESLIIFTDCSFEIKDDLIEVSRKNIVDTNDFNLNFINILIQTSKQLSLQNNYDKLEKEDLDKVFNVCRPDFELHIKKSTVITNSQTEINSFTAEQLKILDWVDDPRMLIEGSQGTGKTSMAEEIIQRKIDKGYKKILFLNSNRLANEDMKDKFNNISEVEFTTYNQFINKINSFDDETIKLAQQKEFIDKHNFLTTEAFKKLKDANINNNKVFVYDVVIIDECQNCYFFDNFYKLLEQIVTGGLLDGSYYLLGDFDNQSIILERSNIKADIRLPKKFLIDFHPIRLINNVRNSREISIQTPIISGLFDHLPYEPSRSESGEIFNKFCKNLEEKKEEFINIIKKLHKDGVSGDQITILSNFTLENSLLNKVDISPYYKIIDLTQLRNLNKDKDRLKNEKTCYFSTTLGFQGLENEIIIYLDPLEDYQKSFLSFANSDYEPQLFYSTFLETFNAMGRACTFLYILWDKKLENFYKNKLTLVSKIMITR